MTLAGETLGKQSGENFTKGMGEAIQNFDYAENVNNIKNADDLADGLSRGMLETAEGMEAVSSAARGTTVAINMAKAALDGFLMAVATWAAGKLLQQISDMAHSSEITTEKAQSAITNFQDGKKTLAEHGEQVESLKNKYSELSKGVDKFGHNVSLSPSQFDEYKQTVESIAELYPQLLETYSDEGVAILTLKGNIDGLTNAYKEERKEAQKTFRRGDKEKNIGSVSDVLEDYRNAKMVPTDAKGQVSKFYNGFKAMFGGEVEYGNGNLSTETLRTQLRKILSMSDKEAQKYIADLSQIQSDVYQELGDEAIAVGQYIRKNYGLYEAAGHKLEVKDIQNARSDMMEDVQTLDKEMADKVNAVREAATTYLYDKGFYDNLSDAGKSFSEALVSSIPEDTLTKISEKEGKDAEKALKKEVEKYKNVLRNNAGIEDVYKDIVNVDKGKESVKSYWDNIKQVSNAISKETGESWKEIANNMFDAKEFNQKYEGVKNLLNDADKSLASGLTLDQLDVAANLEVPANVTYSWKEFQELITQTGDSMKATSFDITAEQTKMSNLQTAISNASSGTGLVKAKDDQGNITSDIDNIKSMYADAVKEIQEARGKTFEEFDWDSVFERSSLGIQLNTEALNTLQATSEKLKKNDLAKGFEAESQALRDSQKDAEIYNNALKQLDSNKPIFLELSKGRAEYNLKTQEGRDALKLDAEAAQANIETHKSNLEAIRDEISQYEALTSAYNKWQIAQQTTNEDAPFQNIISGYDQMKKDFEQGKIGTDDFRQYANMFAFEDLTTAPLDRVVDAFNHVGTKIDGTDHKIKDFMQDGKDGAQAFYEALQDVGAITEKNGEQIIDTEGLAERWDVSQSFLDALGKNLRAYGFDIHFENETKSIADFNKELEEASKNIEDYGLKADEVEKKAGINVKDEKTGELDLSKVNEQTKANAIARRKELEEIAKQGGEEGAKAEAEISYINSQMATLIAQKQEIEKPAILKVDANTLPQTIQPAVEAYGKLVEAKNQLDLSEFSADIDSGAAAKAAEKAKNEFVEEFNNLSADEKIAMGVDPELTLNKDMTIEQIQEALGDINADVEIPVKVKLAEDLHIEGLIGDQEVDLTIKANAEEAETEIKSTKDKMQKDAEKDPVKVPVETVEEKANHTYSAYNPTARPLQKNDSSVTHTYTPYTPRQTYLDTQNPTHTYSAYNVGQSRVNKQKEENNKPIKQPVELDKSKLEKDLAGLSGKVKPIKVKVEPKTKGFASSIKDKIKSVSVKVKPTIVKGAKGAIKKAIGTVSIPVKIAKVKIGDALAGLKDAAFTLTAHTEHAASQVNAVHNAAMKAEEFTMSVNDEAKSDVESTHSLARQSESFTLGVDASAAIATARAAAATISMIMTSAMSVGKKDGTGASSSKGKDEKGDSKLLGTTMGSHAYAHGTVGVLEDNSFYNSFSPSEKTSRSEIALVGEQNEELVVHGNKWWTVGSRGAEFTALPAGSIVFNAQQTKELLSKGFTHGRAHAYGTAHANGTFGNSGSAYFTGKVGTPGWELTNGKSGSGKSSSKSNSSDSAAKTQSKAAETQDEAADKQKEAADAQEEAANKAKEAVEKIFNKFQNKIDLREAKRENARNAYAYKERNNLLSEKAITKYYKGENSVAAKNAKDATKQYKQANAELKKAVADGSIKKNSDEWYELKKKIVEAKNAAKEYGRQILQNYRDEIKARHELRTTKRDTQIESIQQRSSIAGAYYAYTAGAKNLQLNFESKLLNLQSNESQKTVNKTRKSLNNLKSSGTSIINKQLKTKKGKNSKAYRKALQNAKKAMASGNAIASSDLKTIAKNVKDGKKSNLYKYLLQYNEEQKNLKEDIATRNETYTQNDAQITQQWLERYQNITSETNNKISLNESKANNAIGAAAKNAELNYNYALNDKLLSNEVDKVNHFKKAETTAAKKLQSLASTKAAGKSRGIKYSGASAAVKKKIDADINKVLNCISKGTRIDSSVLNRLDNYSRKDQVAPGFYYACIQYNDALEARKQAEDEKAVMEETVKQQKAAIALEQFNNIKTEYEQKASDIQRRVSRMQTGLNMAEAKGYMASSKFYEAMIGDTEGVIETKMQERIALQNQLNKAIEEGNIQIGDDTWIEMTNTIGDLDDQILEAKQSLIEFQNQMRQLEWDSFDRLIDKIGDLSENFDFASDVIEQRHTRLFDKDTGLINEYGSALVGLAVANRASAEQQVKETSAELRKMDAEKLANPELLNDTNWLDRYRKVQEMNIEAVQKQTSYEVELRNIMEDSNKARLDALQKAIDKRKEELKLEKDAYDYQKNIEKQVKEVSTYQKQLAALSGDTSEEARAKIQQIQVKLQDANEELEQTEYDKFISDQEKILDDLYDDFEEFLSDRTEDIISVIAESTEYANENADTINRTLTEELEMVGAAESVVGAITNTFDRNASGTIFSAIESDVVGIKDLLAQSTAASLEYYNLILAEHDAKVDSAGGVVGTGSSLASQKASLDTLQKNATTANENLQNAAQAKSTALREQQKANFMLNSLKSEIKPLEKQVGEILKKSNSAKTYEESRAIILENEDVMRQWINMSKLIEQAQVTANEKNAAYKTAEQNYKNATTANNAAQNAYNTAQKSYNEAYDNTVNEQVASTLKTWFRRIFGVSPTDHQFNSATSEDLAERLRYWGVANVDNNSLATYYQRLFPDQTWVNDYSHKQQMIAELKKYGFNKGGTLKHLIKQSDEDGLYFGRAGEEILSLDKLKEMQKLVNAFNPLMENMKNVITTAPSGYIGNNAGGNITIENPSLTLELPNVQDRDDFIREIQDNKQMQNWILTTVNTNMTGKNGYLNQRYRV